MKRIVVISVMLSALLMGCKKYPKGGFEINVRLLFNADMNEARYLALTKYEVNGIDSTDFVVSNNDREELKNYVKFFKYERENYYQVKTKTSEFEYGPDILFSNGDNAWQIMSNGIKIRNVLTPNGRDMKWKIQKYKRGEMILSSSKGGYDYRVILK